MDYINFILTDNGLMKDGNFVQTTFLIAKPKFSKNNNGKYVVYTNKLNHSLTTVKLNVTFINSRSVNLDITHNNITVNKLWYIGSNHSPDECNEKLNNLIWNTYIDYIKKHNLEHKYS